MKSPKRGEEVICINTFVKNVIEEGGDHDRDFTAIILRNITTGLFREMTIRGNLEAGDIPEDLYYKKVD